ncbi:Ig-like domain-containing protein [Anaerocolumna chitinilytica]|uniref:BIG2 domain-containing protein n=1 Tax=Anaerocolumna chitinilytica TaxID=1727145 RepID=A0A7I8DI28_9FIRM|nr:Ig-like domain-containing protein [Anaerocolumna chitinilytica]BCJ97347.1 hypothetical protein bsdcttw_03880 [Anaerocolumna chitinilytica]
MMRKSATMLKSMLAKLLVLAMVLSLVGITNTAEAAAKPALSKATASVLVGKKLDLDVNNQVKGASYTWKSSNAKIATVNKNGLIVGKTKGSVTITCTVKTSKSTYPLSAKITVRTPATSVAVSNKVTALNEGQVYSLKTTLKPATSNDLVSWTSSNSKVLKVDAKGKLTAVKTGKATVTAKTLSGKSVKVVVQVTDKAGTVTTQKELNSLLGSGAALITLKTDAADTFKIAAGKYTAQKLVVDAPKADVENSGVFKNIEIKAIKASTWTEAAKGNKLTVTAPSARIVVAESGSTAITVSAGAGTLTLVNNGAVSNVVVDTAVTLTISGTSTAPIPVVANAEKAKVTSSLPLALQANAPVALNLLKGAEKSTVAAATEAAIPTITGDVKITVTVGTGANATTKEVTGEGYTGGTTTGGSTGGSTPILKTATVTGSAITGGYNYTLPVAYTSLESVVVSYDKPYTVSKAMLNELVSLLNNSNGTISLWNSIGSLSYKIDNTTTAEITGTAGSGVKHVTFKGGDLNNREYTVTVTPQGSGDAVITIVGQAGTYELSKLSDNKTLVFKVTNSTSNTVPTFTVTYY